MQLIDIEEDEARRRLENAGLLEQRPTDRGPRNEEDAEEEPFRRSLLEAVQHISKLRYQSDWAENLELFLWAMTREGYPNTKGVEADKLKELVRLSTEADGWWVKASDGSMAFRSLDDWETEFDQRWEALTVDCKFCRGRALAETAHLHDGGWVGDECCWDERLKSTE